MSETKVRTLRLSQELEDELDAVARVEDVSISEAPQDVSHRSAPRNTRKPVRLETERAPAAYPVLGHLADGTHRDRRRDELGGH